MDGNGIPLGVIVDGANRHDMKLTEATLGAVMATARPADAPQHLCLDKGYDFPIVAQVAASFGYTLHLRHRGEERRDLRTLPGYRARRWVVERTHSWFNRFRHLLVRWEKRLDNYLAMLHFAAACIAFRPCLPLFG